MKAFEMLKKLIREGHSELADKFHYCLNESGSIFIGDGDDEAYESGLADWLQENTEWFNIKHGFRASLRNVK